MLGALVWTGVSIAALVVSCATVRAVSEIRGARRYQRTLANIERLDRELGLGDYRDVRFAEDTATLEREIAKAYRAKVGAPAVLPVEEWVRGYCYACSQRVTLNVGYCSGYQGACAKREWERARVR